MNNNAMSGIIGVKLGHDVESSHSYLGDVGELEGGDTVCTDRQILKGAGGWRAGGWRKERRRRERDRERYGKHHHSRE